MSYLRPSSFYSIYSFMQFAIIFNTISTNFDAICMGAT